MFRLLLVIEIPVVINYCFAPVKVFSNILFTISVVPLSTSFAFLRHPSLWFKFETKYCFRALFAGYIWYKQDTHSRFQTFAVIWILYMFFWVFPRRQFVVGRSLGTLCQFHLQRLDVDTVYIQPLKMELTQGSETSANYKLTPGKYPKEHIQDTHCT